MKQIIAFFILVSAFIAPVHSAEIDTLHILVADLGNTIPEAEKESRYQYYRAFLNHFYTALPPRNNEQVVILSAFKARPIWIGSAWQFNQGVAGLLDKLDQLDHVNQGKNYRDKVGVDLVSTYASIGKIEQDYPSATQSNIYMFSSFLDTETVLNGVANPNILSLIANNKSKLPSVIHLPKTTGNIANHTYIHFWVNEEIKPILRHIYDQAKYPLNYQIFNSIESQTQLSSYLEH